MTVWTVEQIKPRLEIFKSWLADRGAEVYAPIHEYELLRFKTDKGTSVFYFKKNGEITFYGEAESAWNAYCNCTSWRARPPSKRRRARDHEINTIRERDGDLCFVCRQYVRPEDESIEHLVAVTHGGPNHISNKFLAHKSCNSKIGRLSAPEKISMHMDACLRQIEERLKILYDKIK